jgi:hypothetical protein
MHAEPGMFVREYVTGHGLNEASKMKNGIGIEIKFPQ